MKAKNQIKLLKHISTRGLLLPNNQSGGDGSIDYGNSVHLRDGSDLSDISTGTSNYGYGLDLDIQSGFFIFCFFLFFLFFSLIL